jgi:hypothetical protein
VGEHYVRKEKGAAINCKVSNRSAARGYVGTGTKNRDYVFIVMV